MSPALRVDDRLRRLLSMLTWLAQVGEASVDEMAAQFGLTATDLVAELEMAACCGVPPYSPDQLLEILVTEDGVSARLGAALAQPRRFTSREGLALAAACQALLAVPGADPEGALARAAAKLDRVLGDLAITVDLDSTDQLDLVRSALEDHRRIRLEYYSAATDGTSERTVVPHRVFTAEGHWYLDGWCEEAGGVRRFRLDRMLEAELGTPFDPAAPEAVPAEEAADGPLRAFAPGTDTAVVRIAVDPTLEWLMESIPAAARIDGDGDRPVWEVQVGGQAWLERLLLRLGPESTVLEPVSDAGLAAAAAARILGRYRD